MAVRPDVGGYNWLARLLGMALVAATLANGAAFYLKRTGIIDHDSYQAYWISHCHGLSTRGSASAEHRCDAYGNTPEPSTQDAQRKPLTDREVASYVYASTGYEIALKLLKDALGAALIAVSGYLIAAGRSTCPGLREAWPIYLLAWYVLLAFAIALFNSGGLLAVAGLRPFLFLFTALLCRWLVPGLTFISACVGLLIAAETLLVPYELIAGLHLNGHLGTLPLAARTAGTMIKPNSLGIFAVIALAFYYCFSENRRYLGVLGVASVILVVASGSATGLVGTVMFWYLLARKHGSEKTRIWISCAGAILVVASLFALPALLGRPSVNASIFFRLQSFESLWAEKSAWQLAIGDGLGTNTNIALNLGKFAAASTAAATQASPQNSDSTITSMLEQFGMVGVLLFYTMLLWAALKDRAARAFYGIVGICSLTINIAELFPVNYLLGLGLATSAWAARRTIKGS